MCMFMWERVNVNVLACVFITAGPSTKLFAWASLLSMRGVAMMSVCVQRESKRCFVSARTNKRHHHQRMCA